MKKLICALLLILASICNAQQVPKPFLIDKALLSGNGLEKIVLKDNPKKRFFQKRLFKGDDLSVFMVSSETGTNTFENFPIDEFVYMFNGEAIINSNTEREQHFYEREFFMAPKGITGKWHIEAGEYLHYELSVISTQRADSTKIIPDSRHILFDKERISGTNITLNEKGYYSDELARGAELTITFKAESPNEHLLNGMDNDRVIALLSGQVDIKDSQNEAKSFYA